MLPLIAFTVFLFLSPFISAVENSSDYENPYHHNNLALAYKQKEGFILLQAPYETLNIGGYVMIDGRFFAGEDQPKSTFLIRRARFFMTGELYHMFRYMFMPRWDNQKNFDLAYAWIDTLRPKWARIRIGLFKKPFSLEALTFDLFRTFNETCLFIKNYLKIIDLGITVYGDIHDDSFAYSLGIFNGRGRELDNNNNKELVGRAVFKLFDFRTFGRCYVGFSGSSGKFDEDLSGDEFITETFNAFWIWSDNPDKPVENHDTRTRLGMDIEWLAGPFRFAAEYLYTNWGKIRRGHRSARFQGQGAYVECSYLLTGENKPRDNPVYPKHNFNPCKQQWGAWEIGARYELFFATKKMIELGFAKGANYLHGPQLALNWYINPRVAVKIDSQYLWFNRPLIRKSGKFRYEIDAICRIQAVF